MNETNNQMGDFFTEQQNVQQHTQINNQPEQIQPQMPQQVWQQYTQYPYYQVNSYNMSSNDKALSKVFRLALLGTSIALIGAIISLVLVCFAFSIVCKIKLPYYQGGVLGVLIYAILGVIIGIVFVPLTLILKKMKSKTPAIVMIVFASLFLAIWLWGLVVFPVVVSNTNYYGVSISTTKLIRVYPDLATLLQISYWSLLPGIISISGWIMLLISGIKGTRIKSAELNANKINYLNSISEEMYGKQ